MHLLAWGRRTASTRLLTGGDGAGSCVRLTEFRGQRWYRVYSGRNRGLTLLVCYGSWALVQGLLAEIGRIARSLGKGTGFSVESGKMANVTAGQYGVMVQWGAQ